MSIRVRPPKLAMAPRGGGIKPPFFALSKIGKALLRWAYNFDGATNRGVFANRLFNSDGDIDISWYQRGIDNTGASPRSIITQCFSTVIAEREFVLRWNGNSGGLQLSVGGLGALFVISCFDGTYRVRLSGATVEVYRNGQLLESRSYTRGTAREPSATTAIGARNAGGAFTEHANGVIRDLRVNGLLYPLSEPNHVIQLPLLSGLGDELITQTVLENPAQKGTQWTYLGGGRWQLIGDGNYVALRFVLDALSVSGVLVEFEVESISGSLRVNPSTNGYWIGDAIVNTVGKKRCYSTTTSTLQLEFVRHNTGQPVTCVIKNISLRPIGTCNPLTLVNTTSPGWNQYDAPPLPIVRWSYNMDAVSNRGVLFARSINTDGDIDIEFRTGPVVPAAGGIEYCIVSQCLTNNFSAKEFRLYFNASENWLQGQVGAAYSPSLNGFKLGPNKHCRWLLEGARLRVFENGVVKMDTTFNRGTAKEPTAQTVIGAETHGSANSFRAFAGGMFYDLKINGVHYPIGERNQTVQLPSPDSLGATAPIVPVNNSSKGSPPINVDDNGWSTMALDGSQTWAYLGFSIPATPNTTYLVETLADYVSSCLAYSTDSAASTTGAT